MQAQFFSGRLTADAKVKTVKGDKQLVEFSIAMNRSYTPKGGERKTITTYVNCSYWRNTGVAQYLTKGKFVELIGAVSVSAYTNSDGNAVGILNFLVDSIELDGERKQAGEPLPSMTQRKTEAAETDDLLF